MHAYLNVYWNKLSTGKHGAFLQFETPDGTRSDGILIEDVLPIECRNQAQAPKEALEFVRLLGFWLVPAAFLQQQMRRAGEQYETQPHKASLPPVDLVHFGMVDADGVINPSRVRAVITLIAKLWPEAPEMGLLDRLFSMSDDLTVIEVRLVAFYRYRDLPRDDDRATLSKLLLPPECRDGQRILKDGELEIALHWLKRDVRGSLNQDGLLWNLNLRELGLVGPDGCLNEGATRAASDYIWVHRDIAPDFRALKAHLADYRLLPTSRPDDHGQTSKTIAAGRLAKARKQTNLNRKRGRR